MAAEYTAKLKTVQKWEKDLNVKLDKVIERGVVIKVKCFLCKKHLDSIKTLRNFSSIWIDGSNSVKKDSIQKHLSGEAHKRASELELRETLGGAAFNEKVVKETPIGKGLSKMAKKDLETLRICFNSVYYLVKQERPFSDYPNLISLQHKNGVKNFKSYITDRAAADFTDHIAEVSKDELIETIKDANYFSLLTDGSTDSASIEEEVIYLLFLKDGKPEVKFVSIETPSHTTAEGLKETITSAFKRIGMSEFHTNLYGFNIDGAKVNTGIHKGLATLLRAESPWLNVVHCFNHRFELAIKYAFRNTFFDEIDTLLTKIYYLYRQSPKRLRELREFSDIYEKSVLKPSKTNGTRWIGHKFNAMNIFLKNYGIFITHLESLSQTDSQALKRSEIEGFVKKWQNAKFPLHMAMYLDVLTPLKVLSISMQQEKHDPVYMLRNVKEFNWSMEKLQLLVENSFDGTSKKLTNYTKFLSSVEQKNGKFVYQDVQLKGFEASKGAIETSFRDMIKKVSSSVDGQFADLKEHPIYDNLIPVLDIETWPEDEDSLFDYGDTCIEEIKGSIESLLMNKCNIENILPQWAMLKQRVDEIKKGCTTSLNYLDVWRRLFLNKGVKSRCADVLHIIEILLITPFTNAKLERMFSRMNRVKTDFRNRLRRERLENCLRISEEGCAITEFNPDKSIERCYQNKVRRIANAKPYKYPNKRKRMEGSSSDNVIDIARYTLSDFEESDSSDNE